MKTALEQSQDRMRHLMEPVCQLLDHAESSTEHALMLEVVIAQLLQEASVSRIMHTVASLTRQERLKLEQEKHPRLDKILVFKNVEDSLSSLASIISFVNDAL